MSIDPSNFKRDMEDKKYEVQSEVTKEKFLGLYKVTKITIKKNDSSQTVVGTTKSWGGGG